MLCKTVTHPNLIFSDRYRAATPNLGSLHAPAASLLEDARAPCMRRLPPSSCGSLHAPPPSPSLWTPAAPCMRRLPPSSSALPEAVETSPPATPLPDLTPPATSRRSSSSAPRASSSCELARVGELPWARIRCERDLARAELPGVGASRRRRPRKHLAVVIRCTPTRPMGPPLPAREICIVGER
jgi:hypothetical protein